MGVTIVGAGYSGLATASLLANAGLEVSLVDEWPKPGATLDLEPATRQTAPYHALADQASSTVKFQIGSIVWAAYRSGSSYQLAIDATGQTVVADTDTLVLACGTTDVVAPFPGATLPGVLTERALRTLVLRHGVVPGKSIAIVGGASSNRLAAQIASWRLGARITNVSAALLESIEGDGQVEMVRLRNGTGIAADAVVLALGEAPDIQLAGMLGVPAVYDAARHGWFVDNRNPLPGLYLTGGSLLGGATLAQIAAAAEQTAGAILGRTVSLADLPAWKGAA